MLGEVPALVPSCEASEAVCDGSVERPVVFSCEGEELVGVLHVPGKPLSRGVLIVVGGPQYRVGSHRQFLLLARDLAAAGIPVFRFDYRGMGDSTGKFLGFEGCAPEIRAAVDVFVGRCQGLREVILWGLCDAASAICLYAHMDNRVAGTVLLNPWVRTEIGEATTRVKHYYSQRILDAEFWRKVLSGRWEWRESLNSFGHTIRRARFRDTPVKQRNPLPDRMAAALKRFSGRIMLILSGNDLTAAEFLEYCLTSKLWSPILKSDQVERYELPHANHTFSKRVWRDQVSAWTRRWVLNQ